MLCVVLLGCVEEPLQVNPSLSHHLDERIDDVSARRAIPEEVRGEATQWMDQWLGEQAPQDLLETAAADAVAYSVWHRIGPVEGGSPGFMRLHRDGLRFAGGDAERATECASETYLDIRERLEGMVERHNRGKSIPDFRSPWPEDEKNTHRYHTIQLRLRLQKKWTRERVHLEYEDPRHSGESGQWEQDFRAADARTYALTLHFAAWWTLLDIKEKRTRDGRLKGRAWWWKMLQHALDLQRVDDLAGDRNDPTEALMRLRLRFSACQGLNPWLRVWAAQHPYWNQVSFGLPDPDNTQAEAAAVEALEALRPALGKALADMDLNAAEQRALEGTLIRGENVRTSTRHMAGAASASRLDRMGELSESAGRKAADVLLGSDGRGGGSGTSGHVHPRGLMARMAAGAAPSTKDLHVLNEAVHECQDCRARWMAMLEMPDYFEAVIHAGSPATVAARPVVTRGWLGVAGVMAAMLLAIWVLPQGAGDVGLRGAESAPAVHLDLVRQSMGTDGTERFDPEVPLMRGDTLYFSISADQRSDVRVWVEGPEGTAELSVQTASQQPQVLGTDGEAIWYRVDRTGTYRFFASSEDTGCRPESCVTRSVEVRP